MSRGDAWWMHRPRNAAGSSVISTTGPKAGRRPEGEARPCPAIWPNRRDPKSRPSSFGRWRHDAQAAIDEIQSLGKGIFPPLLESDGLRAAVSAGAANAPIPVIVKAQDLGRYDPEIEAAAYFCITEAITNSIKYSGSNRIDVRLANRHDGCTSSWATRGKASTHTRPAWAAASWGCAIAWRRSVESSR